MAIIAVCFGEGTREGEREGERKGESGGRDGEKRKAGDSVKGRGEEVNVYNRALILY